jgi:acyl-coenzyme A synthetase/AMP-(fatty) acid ligase/acyl carrier protein
MSDLLRPNFSLPPEQQAIRDKCFHRSGTFVEFPKEDVEGSIPERFEKIVRRYPERLAVKMGDHVLTYGKLNQSANRLARAILARQGVGNEPVAIFVEDGVLVIIAILGILKAGKIFVVIDPSFPEERINYLLEDSQVRLLVAGTGSLLMAKAYLRERTQLINIDGIESSFTSEDLKLCLSPDSLAALVYTSGSTGRPKGVMQNHRNILHTILRDTDAVHISPHAAVYPYCIAKDGFARLAHWLVEEQITIFNSVSSTYRHFVSVLSGECFSHLRLIYIGGEPVFKKDVELYRKHFTENCILVVRMGCGEAGKVCQYMIDSKTSFPGNEVPVGYAHEDLKILLLDDAGEEVGRAGGGEIAVKSRFLSPGYWRMPELTKARFPENPNGGGERIYLSGDLGRMRADGSLFHLGRKDSQVKIRGFQVELLEIEQVLLQHDGVSECLVVCQPDHSGEPRLVGYWVPHKLSSPTVSQLRRWIQKELPNYMIPREFVMLQSLPVTPTGKLDRRALPVPDNSRPELDTLYIAPRNPTEEALVKIWADVLEIEQIGVHDTFFDLGGHSLRAMQVISRVMTTFKVELPIKFLLNSPTVAEMADVIVTNRGRTIGQEDLARLLGEIELLSDKDAQKILAKESARSDRIDRHE